MQCEERVLKGRVLERPAPVRVAFAPAAIIAAPGRELVTVEFVGERPPFARLGQIIPKRETGEARHRHEANRMRGKVCALDGVAPDVRDVALLRDPLDGAITPRLEM